MNPALCCLITPLLSGSLPFILVGGHGTFTIEKSPLPHYEARGFDGSGKRSGFGYFGPILYVQRPFDCARYLYPVHGDFGLYRCVFAYYQGSGTPDLPFEAAVETNRPTDYQFSAELGFLSQKSLYFVVTFFHAGFTFLSRGRDKIAH